VLAQRRFHRRDALFAAAALAGGVRIPAQAVGTAAGLAYPVLCKPMDACGVAAAHVMRVAFGPAAVAAYAASPEARAAGGFVAQEYINHDALLYKVFCVGSAHVVVQTRPSLPNLVPWDAAGMPEPECILFDNAQPVGPQVALWPRVAPSSPCPRVPAQAEFEAIAVAVGQAFGASLFGADVIVDSRTGECVVIDVNYFPSYRGCIDAPQFFDAIIDLIESRGGR
jgi:inositol-1,3,4-trisphosphate 5/6-kinase/inositol-tetrakisphosphate 1-kinase